MRRNASWVIALGLLGCSAPGPTLVRAERAAVVTLPSSASADPEPQRPSPREACKALVATTRKRIAALVSAGVSSRAFDPKDFEPCVEMGEGMASVVLSGGARTVSNRANDLIRCTDAGFDLAYLHPNAEPQLLPLLRHSATCAYHPSLKIVGWGKRHRPVLLVAAQGLFGDTDTLFEEASFFEFDGGKLVPFAPLEELERFVRMVGQGPSGYSAVPTARIVDATLDEPADPRIALVILRIRQQQCGLKMDFVCTAMPGMRVLWPAELDADGGVRFPPPPRVSQAARRRLLETACRSREPLEEPFQAARPVFDAFCSAAKGDFTNAVPPSHWQRARVEYCVDPKRCAYYDLAQAAIARFAAAVH